MTNHILRQRFFTLSHSQGKGFHIKPNATKNCQTKRPASIRILFERLRASPAAFGASVNFNSSCGDVTAAARPIARGERRRQAVSRLRPTVRAPVSVLLPNLNIPSQCIPDKPESGIVVSIVVLIELYTVLFDVIV